MGGISQTEHEKSRQSDHNVWLRGRSLYRWPCRRTWLWDCDVPVSSARCLVDRRTTFVRDIRRPPPRTRLACSTRGKHHCVLSHIGIPGCFLEIVCRSGGHSSSFVGRLSI